MYESFYGLKEKPFSMLPDPGFLYLSKKHQMALTLLEYGLLNQVGFCVVSGETGSGKTTLLRKLLENIQDDVTVGMITNTHKGFGELLDWVLAAFGIHEPGMSTVDMHQRFMEFVIEQYAANKTTLLIVDEAQNMSAEKLEELRMLSNVNSEKDQVLQVILAGQPILKETLRLPELMQFAQRIGVDHHLGSLDEEETYGYINHRLGVAGATREIFTEEACDRVYEYSGGTPRLINLLCDTVMVYGFADQRETIDADLVDEMVQERMKDSIVPLASKTPTPLSERKPKKKKTPHVFAAQPEDSTEATEASQQTPVAEEAEPEPEEHDLEEKFEEAVAESFEASVAHHGVDEAADVDESQLEAEEPGVVEADVGDELDKADNNEAMEPIEEMASESESFDSNISALLSDPDDQKSEPEPEPEPEEHREITLRSPNTIEVLQPEEPPKTKKWVWAVAATVLIAVTVVVFLIGTSDPNQSFIDRLTGVSSGQNQQPVVQAVPENIKRQLEEAERFRQELAKRQEEDRARMQALEEQAAMLQRERDEALAKANAEKKKRAREEELARAAARSERQAQAAAQKAMADALEAERKALRLERLRIEEAARLERELKEQQAKLEAEKAAAALKLIPEPLPDPVPVVQPEPEPRKPEPKPVVQTEKKEKTFTTDPCASSTARFLSTCR